MTAGFVEVGKMGGGGGQGKRKKERRKADKTRKGRRRVLSTHSGVGCGGHFWD